MNRKLLLCLDTPLLQRLELQGLSSLFQAPWLALFTRAELARALVEEHKYQIDDVLLAGADDCLPINAAAALVRELPHSRVILFTSDLSGSCISRARSAGIAATYQLSYLPTFLAKAESCYGGKGCTPDVWDEENCQDSWPEDVPFSTRVREAGTQARSRAGAGVLQQVTCEEATKCADIHGAYVKEQLEFGTGVASLDEAGAGAPRTLDGIDVYVSQAQTGVLPPCVATKATDIRDEQDASIRYAPYSEASLAQSQASGAEVFCPNTSLDCMAQDAESSSFIPHPYKNQGQATGKQRDASTGQARVYAVAGAHGGCGKSTVAALLACFSARQGHKTILLEGDLQLGDMDYCFEQSTMLHIEDLIARPELLQCAPHIPDEPLIIVGPRSLEAAELVVEHFFELLDRLRSQAECIVVNLGAHWVDFHLSVFDQADKIIFLLDQRPSTVHCARRVMDMCSKARVSQGKFVFALNRCSKKALFSVSDIRYALEDPLVAALSDGGREVAELMGAGLVAELLSSRNPLVVSLEGFAHARLGWPNAQSAGNESPRRRSGSLFGRRDV